MKQLDMTPQLKEMIQTAVGPDVDPSNFAVFETIALNTKPLPGKRGTIFEQATVMPVTLMQMVDYINAGNHIPLMADHELFGTPKGRFFNAGLSYGPDGELEMRALFYLDETEKNLISKLNAGSLDEVSVQFLSSAFLCSECGWDYFQFGTSENIYEQTCANGHKIGEDGVHAELVGLNQFVELSVVARGAADNAKIVGKSQAKLAPETTYRLAAHGFKPDALVVRASIVSKEDEHMADNANIMTELTAEIRKSAGLESEKNSLTTELTAVKASVTLLTAERDDLQTKLTAAETKNVVPDDYEPTKAEATAALAYLGKQFDHLTVASGKTKVEGDARPKTVAEFTAKIDELTGGLTSILPVDGVSEAPGAKSNEAKTAKAKTVAAFSLRNK